MESGSIIQLPSDALARKLPLKGGEGISSSFISKEHEE